MSVELVAVRVQCTVPCRRVTAGVCGRGRGELVAQSVRIGYGKVGWYSYDLFDNAGRPSAERILPEFQQPAIGEWVPMAAKVNETTAFKIKAFEPDRFMLWEKPYSTWVWKLEPLDGGRTRLITRLKDRYSWRESPGNALMSLILFEFGDFPMMRKLLLGVRTVLVTPSTSPSSPRTVATVVVSPSTPPGTRSALRFSHYSLFKTTEQLLGLPTLGRAAAPTTRSMRAAFHL